jgi:hypothetical protein
MKKILIAILFLSVTLIGQTFTITSHEIGVWVSGQTEPFSLMTIPQSLITCSTPMNQTPVPPSINNPSIIVWDVVETNQECKANLSTYFNNLPISDSFYTAKVRRYGFESSPTSIVASTWGEAIPQFKRAPIPPPEPIPGDNQAPAVAIKSIKRNGNSPNYTVAVNATDDVGVVSVEFLVDGTVQVRLVVSPYTATVKIQNPGTHTIEIRARDAAGNMGTASASVNR